MGDKKRTTFNIQLNSITDTDNPTRKECEFILHDFDVNWNGSKISKETAEKSLPTLQNMPIVCKYYSVSEPGADDDALGGHEVYIDNDRDSGDMFVATDTIPIGVFTEPAYITTIKDDKGNDVEVVAGKGILWASRFPNIIGLLKEWVDKGVPVRSSMEILYDSYLFQDGIEEILSYTYEGHCILNAEERGDHPEVLPAYDVSKLNKLVAEAININKKEAQRSDNVGFKKVYELSDTDKRSALYRVLDAQLEDSTYSWICDVYDSYFVVNLYGEDFDSYFKYNYTKDNENDTVAIDFESKAEVTQKRDWIEVTSVQQMESQITELSEKLAQKIKEADVATEKASQIIAEKAESDKQIEKLNSEVEELKPFKEQAEKAQYEAEFEKVSTEYEEKFNAVNASNKFKEDEVQELLKKSLNDKEAKSQLNSILVDCVVVNKANDNETLKEVSSKREKLVPEATDFDSRYAE